MGGKYHYVRGYLVGGNIKTDFYRFKKEHGRVPYVREWYAAIRAIKRGEYGNSISDYPAFLKHLGETMPERYPILPKEVFEAAFCECMEDLDWKRMPLRKEFEEKFPELMNRIRRRRFKAVGNYGQMVYALTGYKSEAHERNYWKEHPERVRAVYYGDKKKGKYLAQDEFAKRHPGAWDAVFNGNYDPNIHNWNEFKKSLGEKVIYRSPNLNLESCTKKYRECKKLMGRDLKFKEFEYMMGGAASWIGENVGWKKFVKSEMKYGERWTRGDFIEAYNFLEKRDNQKPSKRKFLGFYGSEQFRNNPDGIKSWNDLERIVNQN